MTSIVQDSRKKISRQEKAQAEWLENTQALPQRGKACSVSGFALLALRARNLARSAFKRFSRHSAFAG